jgi:cleavage stimulation factor subunit 3
VSTIDNIATENYLEMSVGEKRKAGESSLDTAATDTVSTVENDGGESASVKRVCKEESGTPASQTIVLDKDDDVADDDDGYNVPLANEQKYEYSFSQWGEVLDKVLKSDNGEIINKAYGKYLSQYVNDGDRWSEYIGWMMQGTSGELDKKKIEQAFFKILTKVYNVRLWRLYLKYVELINPITPDDVEKARNVVLKAYKFALDTVGIDFFHSHEIWGDYLRYLYMWQALTPTEASTREEFIRKALKTMISYPSVNLEENWRVFTKFETDINMNKSRKIITDATPEYLKLKQFNDELIGITKSISKIKKRKYSSRQVGRWNEWILWEKSNRLSKSDEEVNKRVNYVYNLSVQFCDVLPTVWYNYGNYLLNERNNRKSAIDMIMDGLLVNPTSSLLTNQLSNIYEFNNDVEKIKEIWTKLLKGIEKDATIERKSRVITHCYCLFMTIINRVSNIKEVRLIFKLARQYKGIEWFIYKDYAMLEYYNNEPKIASRSFALGMQTFKSNIEFVKRYLDFLVDIRDMANFKKVIETSIENFKELRNEDAVKVLFRKYLRIEEQFGDINAINNLSKRYMKLFGEDLSLTFICDGLKSIDDGFDPSALLDRYKNGHTNGEGTGDVEITGDKQISNVMEQLNEEKSGGGSVEAPNSTEPATEVDVMARLQAFLAALPQDPVVLQQIQQLSIGEIQAFFSNTGR